MPLKLLPGLLIPKRHRHETPNSYIHRLEQGLLLDPGTLRRVARSTAPTKTKGDVRAEHHRLVEQLTGLASDLLSDVGEQDLYSSDTTRLECIDCADDQHIELVAHAESFCCLQHRRWTGPQTIETAEPRPGPYCPPEPGRFTFSHVNDDVRDAERAYRELRSKGLVPAGLVNEIVDMLRPDDRDEEALPSPGNYVETVTLLRTLVDAEVHRRVLDPTLTYSQAREILREILEPLLPDRYNTATQRAGLLLRPAALSIREVLEGRQPGNTGLLTVDTDHIASIGPVPRPLEPFERCLDGGQVTDWSTWTERHLVAGQLAAIRRRLGRGAKPVAFICRAGHRYRATPNAVSQAVPGGHSGCPYCSGNAALAGFNSMRETHPWLAAQWDQELNESTTPSDITGSGNKQKYWWRCTQEHSWLATPNNRAKGRDCPYCSGRRVTPGLNSLAQSHPELASEWDHDANTLAPGDVSAGSGEKVAWRCRRGHGYRATVDARSRGTGCPVCANLAAVAGFNDLATTHPQIAKEWDHSRNSNVDQTEVVAGSGTRRHWLCPRGHQYVASPGARCAGKGCPFCSGQKVLAGFNDLATTHPDVARDWHDSLNDRNPTQVTAGSGRKAQFNCARGHTYEKVIAKRTAGSACPYCANKKALPGFNDLATRHPAIAKDWHPTKNAPTTPAQTLPGNRRRWWLCLDGHEQHGTVPNRIKTRGCTACEPSARLVPAESAT